MQGAWPKDLGDVIREKIVNRRGRARSHNVSPYCRPLGSSYAEKMKTMQHGLCNPNSALCPDDLTRTATVTFSRERVSEIPRATM